MEKNQRKGWEIKEEGKGRGGRNEGREENAKEWEEREGMTEEGGEDYEMIKKGERKGRRKAE